MTKRLGKGLADIIESSGRDGGNFVMLRVEQIRPGRFQPRSSIPDGSLEELKASIKRTGVIEPVVVRPLAHGSYELVAGERRLRASQALGIKEVPTIIRPLSDQEALEFSLIENVQRENLNPIDEAKGYERLVQEFRYTQERIAEAIGKDRTTIANMLRLLTLPGEIQRALRDGAITMGHAKALLAVEGAAAQLELLRRMLAEQLSVRAAEALTATHPSTRRARRSPGAVDPQLKSVEDELRRLLGTKVSVRAGRKRGRIVIEYYSTEDFTRLLQLLRGARA